MKISQEEMQYLCKVLARVFPTAPQQEPLATFSSLRPLATGFDFGCGRTRLDVNPPAVPWMREQAGQRTDAE